MFLFPFLFLYPFVISHIAKILIFSLTCKHKTKNFTAKVHFFCIIEKVRAMCVPYLKN